MLLKRTSIYKYNQNKKMLITLIQYEDSTITYVISRLIELVYSKTS